MSIVPLASPDSDEQTAVSALRAIAAHLTVRQQLDPVWTISEEVARVGVDDAECGVDAPARATAHHHRRYGPLRRRESDIKVVRTWNDGRTGTTNSEDIMSIIRTRWAAIGAAIAVTLGAGGIGIVSATQPGDAVAFVPITPCRVMDTRTEFNVGPKTSPLGPGEVYTVNTTTADTGNCTTIPTTATGVSLNITALDATLPTFLTVWETGDPQPEASSLNPVPGQPPTPNAVTTGINPGGQFDIYNLQGNVQVIADINGYYTDHQHDDRYYTKGQSNDRYYTKGESNNRYPTKTQTIVVPAAAFAKNGVTATDEWESSATSARVHSGFSFMTAPIPIPVGSTITGVRYNYRDNSATIDIDFIMYLVPPDVLAATEVAGSAFASTGASGDLRTGSVDLDVVVPERNGVAVGVHAPNWASYTGPLTARSVEVDYVLP